MKCNNKISFVSTNISCLTALKTDSWFNFFQRFPLSDFLRQSFDDMRRRRYSFGSSNQRLRFFLLAGRLGGKRFCWFGLLYRPGSVVLLFGPHFGPGVSRPLNIFMLFPEALAALVKIDSMFQLSAVRRTA